MRSAMISNDRCISSERHVVYASPSPLHTTHTYTYARICHDMSCAWRRARAHTHKQTQARTHTPTIDSPRAKSIELTISISSSSNASLSARVRGCDSCMTHAQSHTHTHTHTHTHQHFVPLQTHVTHATCTPQGKGWTEVSQTLRVRVRVGHCGQCVCMYLCACGILGPSCAAVLVSRVGWRGLVRVESLFYLLHTHCEVLHVVLQDPLEPTRTQQTSVAIRTPTYASSLQAPCLLLYALIWAAVS